MSDAITPALGVAHYQDRKSKAPVCGGAKLEDDTWARKWDDVTCTACHEARQADAPTKPEPEPEPVKVDPKVREETVAVLTAGYALTITPITRARRVAPVPPEQLVHLSEKTVDVLAYYGLLDVLEHPAVALLGAAVAVGMHISRAPKLDDADFKAIYGAVNDDAPQGEDAA